MYSFDLLAQGEDDLLAIGLRPRDHRIGTGDSAGMLGEGGIAEEPLRRPDRVAAEHPNPPGDLVVVQRKGGILLVPEEVEGAELRPDHLPMVLLRIDDRQMGVGEIVIQQFDRPGTLLLREADIDLLDP